jgi:hypothetical protein
MINNLFIVISLSLLIIITGCEKFLEEKPLDTLSPENFYKTSSDAIASVNGIYDVLRVLYRSNIMRMDEVPSDDVYPGLTADPWYHRLDQYTFDPENETIIWTWRENYRGIARANAALYYIPQIEMDESLKYRLLGETKFLRALFYFKLVQYYGDIPLVTQVFTTLDGLNVPRDSSALIYEQVIEDLEFAAEYLPLNYNGLPPENNLGRATSGAAKALLAKVYLTRGCMENLNQPVDFENAALYALEVIESGEYSLESNYEDVFFVDNQLTNKEVIFAWWAMEGTNQEGSEFTRSLLPRTFANKVINGEGRSFFLPEKEAWSSYTIGDIRRDVNILWGEPGHYINYIDYYGDTIWTDFNGDSLNIKIDYPHIWKYKDFNSQSSVNDNVNFPILRYADVLLMHTEALNYIHNGPTVEACEYINRVRERARNKAIDEDGLPIYWFSLPDYSPDQFSNAEEFLEAIMDERRWELMFEAHRWTDLVRWGKLIEVLKEAGIEHIQDHHTLYPIPQQEMDVNPALTQNTGYN